MGKKKRQSRLRAVDRKSLAKATRSSFNFSTAMMSETGKFYSELGKIFVGQSDIAPDGKDWRFQDESWTNNPLLKRWQQAYLAWSRGLMNLAEGNSDWKTRERAVFAMDILTTTFSPTNTLAGNPAALKRAVETKGQSIIDGIENLMRDMRDRKLVPSQVDASAFRVGENLAATPGDVVYRTPVLELIQYKPSTKKVAERPLMIIPPQISRYYFLDLSPGRSMVEYAVNQGLQVFMISWRNPDSDHASWNMDTYVEEIMAAIDVVRDISGSETINTQGFCSGGITMTCMLARMARKKDKRVNAAGYAVTLLDFDSEASIGGFRARNVLETARQRSSNDGVIRGDDLGMLFSWLRPNDLVWNYWVNNYLMGKKPPSFDILAWNADGTNLSAALHKDFLNLFETNALCRPGAFTVLGTPIDVSAIKQETFVTGALTDHLTPWEGCFRTTQMLGGKSTFVLSSSGHIASLVNPPGNKKSRYFTNKNNGLGPEVWRKKAKEHQGSWWESWSRWMLERSGEMKPASRKRGNKEYFAIEPAPGAYVFS